MLVVINVLLDYVSRLISDPNFLRRLIIRLSSPFLSIDQPPTRRVFREMTLTPIPYTTSNPNPPPVTTASTTAATPTPVPGGEVGIYSTIGLSLLSGVVCLLLLYIGWLK